MCPNGDGQNADDNVNDDDDYDDEDDDHDDDDNASDGMDKGCLKLPRIGWNQNDQKISQR